MKRMKVMALGATMVMAMGTITGCGNTADIVASVSSEDTAVEDENVAEDDDSVEDDNVVEDEIAEDGDAVEDNDVVEADDIVEADDAAEDQDVAEADDAAEDEELTEEANYTVEDIEAKTMYASTSLTVRTGPSTEYSKVGTLSVNEAVTVTGVADTGWYRLDYNGAEMYASNKYLQDTQVAQAAAGSFASTQSTDQAETTETYQFDDSDIPWATVLTDEEWAALWTALVAANGGTTYVYGDTSGSSVTFSEEYKSGPYYQALQNVTLTGNYRADIIAIAQSQIGYHEGDQENQLDGTVQGSADYSEYGRYLGSNGTAWCSEFASWCNRMANVPTSILNSSKSANVEKFGAPCYTWNQTIYAGGSYVPNPGDLVLFAWDGTSTTATNLSHTAIVCSTEIQGDTVAITVIHGNANNSVRMDTYYVDCSNGYMGKGYLVYFVAPDYD